MVQIKTRTRYAMAINDILICLCDNGINAKVWSRLAKKPCGIFLLVNERLIFRWLERDHGTQNFKNRVFDMRFAATKFVNFQNQIQNYFKKANYCIDR